jgi:hypothetical protein
MDAIRQALDQSKAGHYDSAAALLRGEVSGIEWSDDDANNPTLERDCDLLHAVNACHAARLYPKDATLARQALANLEALVSGDRSDLEAMEERDATVALIEAGLT